MTTAMPFLRTSGKTFAAEGSDPIRLRGVAVAGWLNMENFITGFPATESAMRAALRKVLGEQKYEVFFERLLEVFFTDADAAFLAQIGLNAVRVPVNYHHFEDDARPFQIRQDGFRHLDRIVELCARRGIYSIIDLHALPGSQNQRWHSDNLTHVASFWQHPHFQDRAVNIWEAIADRYKDEPAVAGYNPVNEPGDEAGNAVGPFYSRVAAAIRAIDPRHTLFLDGNTYSTEFGMFTEPLENTVYACHDYVEAGLGYGGPYPGLTRGKWIDRPAAENRFRARTDFCRQTQTPIWVGEFGPIYRDDTVADTQLRQLLQDQLEIYDAYDASWSLWTYKDIGKQGLVYAHPDSAYRSHVAEFVAKKERLAVDNWGSDGEGPKEITRPFQEFMEAEFPTFDPYPWGRWDWVKTLLLNITMAQPLVPEYAELFRGLSESDLIAMADSFAFENCVIREPMRRQLEKSVAAP